MSPSSRMMLLPLLGKLTVTRKSVVVTANSYSKQEGEIDPKFTAKVEGLLEGDEIEYKISRKSGNKTGSYTITASGEAIQGNYEVSYENGSLKIKAAPVVEPEQEEIADPQPVEPVDEEIIPVIPEIVEETEVPLAYTGNWALANLLSAIGAVMIALGMALTRRQSRDDREDEENDADNYWSGRKLFGVIPAAASVIVFMLTENVHRQMVLTDRWTVIMVAILLVSAILAYMTRNNEKEADNSENTAAA